MSRKCYQILSFIKHYFTTQSKFRLHSPFIYRFYSIILKNKQNYPAFQTIEKIREGIISDRRLIKRTDLGAGSGSEYLKPQMVKAGTLAKKSSLSSKKGRLLYRITRDLQPLTILELGTCLGISTLYMAEAAPDAQIITIEGCPETSELARQVFDKAGKTNISLLNGSFDETLPEVFKKMPRIDLLFIDGDHREQTMLNYWAKCSPYLQHGSVAVFDDIHWSFEMEMAWRKIKADTLVKVSIDLYDAGITYFKEELSKEDFVLRF